MRLPALALLAVCLIAPAAVAAPTVYSGFDVSFSKPAGGDWELPANQDFIVSDVILTRGDSGGLFNVAQELSFVLNLSPIGTEWAFLSNNPGQTIAATNWAALTFEPWDIALGGSGNLATNIDDAYGVLHLVDHDIYLDIHFLDDAWGVGSTAGGRFAYERAAIVPVPEPACFILAGFASIIALAVGRR